MSVRSRPHREGEASAEPERNGSDLPEGWATATLRELVDVLDSRRIPINSDERAKRVGDVPYFGATGQVGWIDDFLFDEEILLIGEDGAPFFDKSKPIAYIVRGKSWVNNHAHVLRANGDATSNHYLKCFLDWFDFNGFVNGTTRLKLTQAAMNSIPVRVAPLAEQRRIVGKLELLLGKVSSSQQRLSRVPSLLKRFRQSVLAAACSGKLTADWREENECVEPASDLIARLGSERRERYRDLCIAAKNAKRGKPQEFDNIEPSLRTDLDTFDLPSDWSWVDLRFVMTVDEPFCYGVVQPGANEPNGKLLVRAGDLQNGTVNLSELRRIPADIDAEYERSRLKGGELLVTVVGAGIGTVAIAPESCAGFNIARAVAKVPIRDVSAEYVFHWFNTSKALSWMVGDAREVARPTLNLEQLRTIPVPLPPLSEQQEIVRRVEMLFAFADQIEARLKQAQMHVGRITQSLLAKAFRGELVPTEHTLATAQGRDYESASELLARIQTKQHTTAATVKPKRKQRTAKQG